MRWCFDYGGVPVPAHINRGSNGMIGALGLMPFLPEHPGDRGLARMWNARLMQRRGGFSSILRTLIGWTR